MTAILYLYALMKIETELCLCLLFYIFAGNIQTYETENIFDIHDIIDMSVNDIMYGCT